MTFPALPPGSSIIWRRIDVPGREESHIEPASSGWCLKGILSVNEQGITSELRYRIECDRFWRTRSARIDGESAGRPVRFALLADGNGRWTNDGQVLPDLAGALDVDLGFTPATNMLPIRRLDLTLGGSAQVRSAWLRFPELRIESLEQTYTREDERTYRYEADIDGKPFRAKLDTDLYGRVLHYEGLWQAEHVEPAGLGSWAHTRG